MRQKLKRFKENTHLDHCIEPGKAYYNALKGKWHSHYFKNDNPITLEIGCGHGAYTIGLAKLFPDRNIIGIDIKGDRIWKGAKQANLDHLTNVAFLRILVESLDDFFEKGEINEIWITFPDPRLKNKDIKRRLTSPRFLDLYQSVLGGQGKVHIKTDSAELYHYTIKNLQMYPVSLLKYSMNIYGMGDLDPQLSIQTTYEKRFLAIGKQIYYICFRYL